MEEEEEDDDDEDEDREDPCDYLARMQHVW